MNIFLGSLRPSRIIRLLFGRISTQDAGRRRLLGIIQGAVTSLGGKLIGVLVSFLSVPLTINYLGAERYGAWVTLGALLAWLQLTDLGLGNGLTNAVSADFARNRLDLVRVHVSNAAFLMLAISCITGLIVIAAWPFLTWSSIFGLSSPGAQSEIGTAVMFALLIFILQFPLSLSGRILPAMQEGRLANYWAMAGSVLSLVSLVAVTQTRGGLSSLVLAVSGTWLLVNALCAAWLFIKHRPALAPRLNDLRLTAMRSLGNVGGKFFLIQIMGMVTFQTDTFVISHYLGAVTVPEYSLTYNLFNYSVLPHTLIFSYLWVAYSEAIARHDIRWVKRAFHLSLAVGMTFTVMATAVLVGIARPFILWWSAGHVEPSSDLVYWMAAWTLVNSFTMPMACLLAAASHLKTQTMYSALATVTNLLLSIYLAQLWGLTGVIAATVLSYAVFICGPIIIDAEMLLQRLQRQSPMPKKLDGTLSQI